MSNHENITESIFDSISLIVENRLAGLDYNKTIVCTVVDDSNAKNDKYIVSDGSIRFEACGQGNKYSINDSVRVEISNNDWSKTKYIQGKHSASNDLKPLTYVSPLNSILKLTDNLIERTSEGKTKYSLAANAESEDVMTSPCIARININADDLKNTDIFNSIYVRADFQTDFNEYSIRSGDYGLLLVLSLTDDGKNQAFKFSAVNDMFGNPYAFKVFTTQEKVYELPSDNWSDGLAWIDIYFYQDNKFQYYDDNENKLVRFSPRVDENSPILENLKVKNIQVGFGSQIYSIPDNDLKIYTNSENTFTVKSRNPINWETKDFRLVWYNKTEDNEYIGFSDGKDAYVDGVYAYDEINYINETKAQSRLLNQKSDDYYDDELCLTIAADGNDISNIAIASAKIIGESLYKELLGLDQQTKALSREDGLNTLISNMLTTGVDASDKKSLSAAAAALSEEAEDNSLYNQYKKILKDKKTTSPADVVVPDSTTIDQHHTNLLAQFQNTLRAFGYKYNQNIQKIEMLTDADITSTDDITLTTGIMPELLKLIEQLYPTKRDIYTSYRTRIERLLTTLNKNYRQIQSLLNNNKITELLNKNYTEVPESYEDSLDNEQYDNKYCIYWYRQNLSYTDPSGIMPPGWERITSQDNKGIPAADTENPGYLQARADAAACQIAFNRYVEKEIIKAVLFYDHIKYVSAPLEFENTEPVTNTDIDRNGALYLEHYEQAHSQDLYQLYDANGLLINAAETQKPRTLRVRFECESGNDEQLAGATVYWYVPLGSTMLEVYPTDVTNKFSTDRIKTYNNYTSFTDDCKANKITNHAGYLVDTKETSSTDSRWKIYIVSQLLNDYVKIYESEDSFNNDTSKDVTKKYLIQKSDWDGLTYLAYEYLEDEGAWKQTEEVNRFVISDPLVASPDNVAAQIADPLYYKPGYACYYKTIGAVSNGDGAPANIDIADTLFTYHVKDYYNQTLTQNTIFCQVVKDGVTYYADKIFTFSSFGNNGTDYTLTVLPDARQNVVTADESLNINITLYDNNGEIIDIPAGEPGTNPINVCWDGPSGYNNIDIRYNNDNTKVVGVTVNKTKIDNAVTDNYAGILKCTLSNTAISTLGNKKVNLETSLPISYSDATNYYIEGATSIIYDSFGTNPYYYKTPYKLFDINNQEVEATWSIEYYCNNIKYDDETNINKFIYTSNEKITIITTNKVEDIIIANADKKLIQSLSLNYLPKLNTANNMLTPSVMYVDNLNIYPVVIAKKNGSVLYAQPILIIKNRYSSPMINSWDGSLTIDETNNTIMSMMMGAGRKNNDNQFEGVLMGDVRTGTRDDATAIGLYGYHNGAQSFGFKVDGTAFLGKADGGRIYMDGNNAFLYSQAWLTSQKIDPNTGKIFDKVDGQDPHTTLETAFKSDGTPYQGTAGMLIDLEKGSIDAYNFKLTTGNFILSSTHIPPSKTNLTNWYNEGTRGNIIFNANNLFAITDAGHFYAINGSIGGWNVDSNGISKGNTVINAGDDLLCCSLATKHVLKAIRFAAGEKIASTDQDVGEFTFEFANGYSESMELNDMGTYTIIWPHDTKLLQVELVNAVKIPGGLELSGCTISTDKIATDNSFQVVWPWQDNKEPFNIKIICKCTYEIEYNKPIFGVLDDGSLYTSALEATGGTIGGWEIDRYALQKIRSKIVTATNGEATTVNQAIFFNNKDNEPFLRIGTFNEAFQPGGNYFEINENGVCTVTSGTIGTFKFDKNDKTLSCGDDGRFIMGQYNFFVSEYKLNKTNTITLNRKSTTKELIIAAGNSVNVQCGAIMVRDHPIGDSSKILATIKIERWPDSSDVFGVAFKITVTANDAYTTQNIPIHWALRRGGTIQKKSHWNLTIKPGEAEKQYEYSEIKYETYDTYGCAWVGGDDLIGFGLTEEAAITASGSSKDIDKFESQTLYPQLDVATHEAYYTVEAKGHFVPYDNDRYDLGTTCDYTSADGIQKKWRNLYLTGTVYASSANVTTATFTGDIYANKLWYTEACALNKASDIRIKNSISNLPLEYETFFDKMQPTRYKYNEGTSNRFHTGFIAQQLVSALEESNLTTQDFAGVFLDHPGEEEECWYLRRDEFVALNTWQIQKLKPRMTEAEERIYKLEQELKELKAQLL